MIKWICRNCGYEWVEGYDDTPIICPKCHAPSIVKGGLP